MARRVLSLLRDVFRLFAYVAMLMVLATVCIVMILTETSKPAQASALVKPVPRG
ncbi:hypothetical protein ACN2XU_08265 [Primorskyibacter sp. 2E107]|uniref:hypothetical protein n=1 Tax=Primorskyibacter sp. 2E107 TaxID=3403458 RepID=UPI003AF4D6C9